MLFQYFAFFEIILTQKKMPSHKLETWRLKALFKSHEEQNIAPAEIYLKDICEKHTDIFGTTTGFLTITTYTH